MLTQCGYVVEKV